LRNLKKVSIYIAIKLEGWINDVAESGLGEVRKIPGYRDEPLKGTSLGQGKRRK